MRINLVPRACDPREGTRGSGIIRCRKPGILAKIELRIHFNGQSDSSLKRVIPEPRVPFPEFPRIARMKNVCEQAKFQVPAQWLRLLHLCHRSLHPSFDHYSFQCDRCLGGVAEVSPVKQVA